MLKCIKKGRADDDIIIKVLNAAEAKKYADLDLLSSSHSPPTSDDDEGPHADTSRKKRR